MEKIDNAAVWTKPYEILDQAEKFRKAAQRLREGVPEQGKGPIVMPSCICAALSIELYFKFMIYAENENLDELKEGGHKLDDLFCKVPSDLSRRVLDNIAPTIPEVAFIKILSDYREAFEIWRYAYEYNKITISTQLHQIADLLSIECKKINDALPI